MKKGLKVLAATTAAAMLLSMSMSAMAAEYATTTTYAIDEDGKEVVNVATTVYGLNGTEEVTYLVTKPGAVEDEDASEGEIVYVDQANAKDAVEGNLVFDFKADCDDLVNYAADVLVGSDAEDAITVKSGEVGNVVVNDNKVTFSAVNGTVYVDAADTEATEATTKLNEITFYLVPDVGYTVTGTTATKNGETLEIVAADTVKVQVANDDNFVFTFAAIAEDAEPNVNIANPKTETAVKDGKTYTANKFEKAETRRQFTLFGSALGAREYGILVSDATFAAPKNADELNALIADGVVKLAAAGASGAGRFAISVYEDAADGAFTTKLKGEKVYACVYAINGSNVKATAVAEY